MALIVMASVLFDEPNPMLCLLALAVTQQAIIVTQNSEQVVVNNGQIKLTLDNRSGTWDAAWPTFGTATKLFAETKLNDGKLLNTTGYARHEIQRSSIKDKFGKGVRIVWYHRSPNEPELEQTFWVYENKPEAIVQLKVRNATPVSTNYLSPIQTVDPIRLKQSNQLQSLFVPYDNDMYFRYRSDGWGEGEGDGDGSYGVGAVYDDASRNGLVVGSIDNDIWKSAVRFKRNAGFRAFAGVTSKYTHDSQPHGSLSGREVSSPRMVIGLYPDWRSGLERYGDLNALVKPPLKWNGSVPFGWNSWAGHKTKVKASDAQAATDFVHDELPQLRNDKIAYINFDSFWDNLTKEQLLAFVKRVHSLGLKAGIYFTPFTGWGELKSRVDDGPYHYQDIALKDAKGEPLPKLDGGWPLDPTHPGTLARNRRKMADFVAWGFDFVKLDFLSHGSLEGRHADSKIRTGSEAYALGMRDINECLSLQKAGRPIFISLSIAPMFPHGFAHSRRISCDVFANIGATEYLLNSSTYGWWNNRRLYQFTDADATCLYQPMDEPPVTEEEAVSRFTASVISGGMMLSGDDLTKPEAKERAKKLFANTEVLALARKGITFRPVNGDSGTKAGDMFVWAEKPSQTLHLAIFNFEKVSATKKVSLSRLGMTGKSWQGRDLWTGKVWSVEGDITLDLKPMQCAFLRLQKN